MWGLEYALLFAVPDNKIELIRGRSRWAFPFQTRELAEAHFAAWQETLARWKQRSERPAVRKAGGHWRVKIKGISMELFPRPIELRIPIAWKAFDAFYETFWQPAMWPGEPQWRKRGWLAALDHQDVQMNLWRLFGEFCQRHGGQHSGRVDIVLSDTAAVAPDQYYFAKSRSECMIEGDYFCGIPDLIAEVLSPASLVIDREPRLELYRRSGVRHVWLLDPDRETVVVHELNNKHYQLVATYGAREAFKPALFPDETVLVDMLFQTQSKRHGDEMATGEPEPIPQWIISPDVQLGLEYFFLLGHPEHRWEIWANKVPSVLAFGSSAEAKSRLPYFLQEACSWEGIAAAASASLGDDIEQAEVGRFKFTRSGRHVHLDVAVDARKYRELLTVWTKRDAWDWGEK